jgi:5-methylcytosine-specific restriction protein A
MPLNYILGNRYHRIDDIHDIYGGNRYRGISTLGSYPFIFLFYGPSGETHGYNDGFVANGRFRYTGEGREGDMQMEAGNRAIRDHQLDGNELHVFEQGDGPWQVTYVGQFVYDLHRRVELPDQSGNLRMGIQFELVPYGNNDYKLPVTDLRTVDLAELYTLAEDAATGGSRTSRGGQSYTRSEVVRTYAKQRAGGICEACDSEAPFKDAAGNPYLEVHHLHRLSDGGIDHPRNVAAICPNCHRHIHAGADGAEYNNMLINKINEQDVT